MVFGIAYATVDVTTDDVVVAVDIDGGDVTFKDAFVFDVDKVVDVLFIVEVQPATRIITINTTDISALE